MAVAPVDGVQIALHPMAAVLVGAVSVPDGTLFGRCFNCQWYDLEKESKYVPAVGDEGGYSYCRKNPPRFVERTWGTGQPPNISSEWPQVSRADWCGRWRVRG